MVRTLLIYVAVFAIPVAVFWLAGRLLGLTRPFSGPTGRAWLDAEDAFDQARRKHQRHRLAAALHGQPHRLDLPTLKEAATLGLGGSRNAGEQEILLRDIVGATDGADGKFSFVLEQERTLLCGDHIVDDAVPEALPAKVKSFRIKSMAPGHGQYIEDVGGLF